MAKGTINLKEISDVKLREDGNEAQLTFTGKTNQSLTVTLSLEQLQALESQILDLIMAARFNQGTHSDALKTFNPVREVHLVTEMELHLALDGSIDFVIQNRENHTVQFSLHPEHGQAIRKVLCGNGGEYLLS